MIPLYKVALLFTWISGIIAFIALISDLLFRFTKTIKEEYQKIIAAL